MAEEAVLVAGRDSEGRNALAPPATGWPTGQSILLRFALLFFFLQFFPFPFNVVSGTDGLTHAYSRLWATVAPWVARHVFRLTETFPTYPGSSDTIFDYLRLFCVIALAVVTTLVWSLADRRRRDYARLHECLRAYVRYFLATTLLAYGIVKMFGGQFGPPLIALLMQPYGKTTPLDLLWTFMGISTAYKFFAGAAETVGAVLLYSRRTTTLGALVLLAVLSNVVMLNLAYDAPVKLFSSQLLLMTCFLLVPEAARLVDFFVLHRPTTPVEIRPYFASALAHRSALAAKALLIGLAMYSAVVAGWGQVKRFGPSAPEHPLHGFYEVEEFAADGSTLPPLFTDSRRWRTMIVEKRGTVIVRAMDDSRKYFQSTADTTKGELTLSLLPDRTQTVSLAWSHPDPAHLLVQGEFFGESVTVHLKRTDESTFPLVRDTEVLPTFVVREGQDVLGFLTLREHFPETWEVHCVAICASHRRQGLGVALHSHIERWLVARGARVLQVKTLAATNPSPEYAETRLFYTRLGYLPLEIFPKLWEPRLPVLLMIKPLAMP